MEFELDGRKATKFFSFAEKLEQSTNREWKKDKGNRGRFQYALSSVEGSIFGFFQTQVLLAPGFFYYVHPNHKGRTNKIVRWYIRPLQGPLGPVLLSRRK
jgi:hypothetical protein